MCVGAMRGGGGRLPAKTRVAAVAGRKRGSHLSDVQCHARGVGQRLEEVLHHLCLEGSDSLRWYLQVAAQMWSPGEVLSEGSAGGEGSARSVGRGPGRRGALTMTTWTRASSRGAEKSPKRWIPARVPRARERHCPKASAISSVVWWSSIQMSPSAFTSTSKRPCDAICWRLVPAQR